MGPVFRGFRKVLNGFWVGYRPFRSILPVQDRGRNFFRDWNFSVFLFGISFATEVFPCKLPVKWKLRYFHGICHGRGQLPGTREHEIKKDAIFVR